MAMNMLDERHPRYQIHEEESTQTPTGAADIVLVPPAALLELRRAKLKVMEYVDES